MSSLPFESPPPFELRRMRRKTVAIHVRDGVVEVRAPLKAPREFIDRFVAQKQGWIESRLAEQRLRERERPVLHDGAALMVAGKPLVLRWQTAVRDQVTVSADGELLFCGRALDERRVQGILLRWLQQQAVIEIGSRVEQLVGQLGLQSRYTGLCFRYTRTLWGRCSARGELLFNPLILLAPVEVLDYLVAHEVSHLRHMNHSAAFWALVESVHPRWRDSRRWLREHGHRLRVM